MGFNIKNLIKLITLKKVLIFEVYVKKKIAFCF